MSKKYVSLTLAILVINLACGVTIFASDSNEKDDAKAAEKVKTEITKLGTGKDARVEVKLKDGTKLKGYVSQINENSFVVVNEKTGVNTEVPFPQTKQVTGHNLSKGAKIAIGIAVAVGIIVAIGLIFAHRE